MSVLFQGVRICSLLTDPTVRAVEVIVVIKMFIVQLASLRYMYAVFQPLKHLDSHIPPSVLHSL